LSVNVGSVRAEADLAPEETADRRNGARRIDREFDRQARVELNLIGDLRRIVDVTNGVRGFIRGIARRRTHGGP
jgi:hypothetical protein